MTYGDCIEDEFDSYYVLKVETEHGKKYFFSPRLLVNDIGLAKKFNTLRSIRRNIKLLGISQYEVEKLKRPNIGCAH